MKKVWNEEKYWTQCNKCDHIFRMGERCEGSHVICLVCCSDWTGNYAPEFSPLYVIEEMIL